MEEIRDLYNLINRNIMELIIRKKKKKKKRMKKIIMIL